MLVVVLCIVSVICLNSFVSAQVCNFSRSYDNYQLIGDQYVGSNVLSFAWSVIGDTPQDSILQIGLHGQVSGYLAVGPGDGPLMSNMTAWLGTGTGDLFEGQADGFSAPTYENGTGDLTLVFNCNSGGFSTIEFDRPFITNDPLDFPMTSPTSPVVMNFAWSNDPSNTASHTGRRRIDDFLFTEPGCSFSRIYKNTERVWDGGDMQSSSNPNNWMDVFWTVLPGGDIQLGLSAMTGGWIALGPSSVSPSLLVTNFSAHSVFDIILASFDQGNVSQPVLLDMIHGQQPPLTPDPASSRLTFIQGCTGEGEGMHFEFDWAGPNETRSGDLPFDPLAAGPIPFAFAWGSDTLNLNGNFFAPIPFLNHTSTNNAYPVQGRSLQNFTWTFQTCEFMEIYDIEITVVNMDDGNWVNWTDSANNMTVAWKVVDDILYLGLASQTSGYLAIGPCDGPHMNHQEMDSWIGWIDQNGTFELKDMHVEGISNKEDSQNDLTPIQGCERFGRTLVEFSRPLDTKDSNLGDDIVISVKEKRNWCFAWSSEDALTWHRPKNVDPFAGRQLLPFSLEEGEIFPSTSTTSTFECGLTRTYQGDMLLGNFSELRFLWNIKPSPQEPEYLEMALTLENAPEHWIAIGFGDGIDGAHGGFDVILGAVDHLWEAELLDYFGSGGDIVPSPDTEFTGNSDVTLLTGCNNYEILVLEFDRPLVTEDCGIDFPIYDPSAALNMAFAYGPLYKLNENTHWSFPLLHTYSAWEEVTFSQSPPLIINQPETPTFSPPFLHSDKISSTYEFHWTLYTDRIRIGIIASSPGWVAAGISNSSGMKNADIFAGDDSGKIQDLNTIPAVEKYPPKIDDSQDMHILSVQRIGCNIAFDAWRFLETPHSSEDISINPEINHTWIFAWGRDTWQGAPHHWRAAKPIHLGSPETVWPFTSSVTSNATSSPLSSTSEPTSHPSQIQDTTDDDSSFWWFWMIIGILIGAVLVGVIAVGVVLYMRKTDEGEMEMSLEEPNF